MTTLLARLRRRPLYRALRARATAAIVRWDGVLERPGAWKLSIGAILSLQAALIVLHQPWLDEVQAAQIAVQAPDIPTMLSWLRYEGHPPAWYLLLRGLAYFVDPLSTLRVATLVCAVAAQLAILLRSPFTRAERLLLATSEFILFEYLTVGRSLTLGVAAMIIAAALWRRRTFWVALALMPLCDFLFGAISVAFIALKLRERAVWLPGVALWLVASLGAAWSVRPAPDVAPAEAAAKLLPDAMHWISTMGDLLVPWQGLLLPHWNEPPLFLVAVPLGVGFLYFAWRETRDDRWHRVIMFGLIALTALMTLLVYKLFARHLMLIAILLIILMWRRRAEGARPDPTFRLWLAVTSLCGMATAAAVLIWPFDRSAEVGRFIRAQGLADKHWVTFPMMRSPAVSAATGIDFERTESRCMQSFARWNTKTKIDSYAEATRYFRQEAREHGRGFLLSEVDFAPVPKNVLRPIAQFARGYGGPPAYLYEIGHGLPEKHPPVAPCVAGRRPFTKLSITPLALGKK